jgi:hypothetical protein
MIPVLTMTISSLIDVRMKLKVDGPAAIASEQVFIIQMCPGVKDIIKLLTTKTANIIFNNIIR